MTDGWEDQDDQQGLPRHHHTRPGNKQHWVLQGTRRQYREARGVTGREVISNPRVMHRGVGAVVQSIDILLNDYSLPLHLRPLPGETTPALTLLPSSIWQGDSSLGIWSSEEATSYMICA